MIFRGTFTTRCCGTFSRVDEGIPADDDVAIPQDILRRSDNAAESRILRANPPRGADHPRPAVAAPATPAAACSLLLIHALLASLSSSYASILTPAVSVSILVVVSALKQLLSSLRGHAEHDERSARATSAAAIVVSSN